MAQIIKFRRGSVSSVINAGVQLGEIIIGTGSLSTLDGPVLFIANADGTGNSTPVNKLYRSTSAPSITGHSVLIGLPFYSSNDKTLYRLDIPNNENLDLTGNIANRTVSGSLTLTGSLTVQTTISSSGNISASTMILTGTDTASSWNNGTLIVAGGVGIGKDLHVSGSTFLYGNLTVIGTASIVTVSSSIVEIGDNIVKLNALQPYKRYAGIEVVDSGSAITASLLWDGQNDYWLSISSSNQSSRLIGTTFGTFGSEVSLTSNTLPKATSTNTLGDSLLTDNGIKLSYTGVGGFNTTTVTASIISASTALISGQITSSALTANTFITVNSSQALQSIATTNQSGSYLADLYLAWNSSSNVFFATQLIDGGTF